MGWPWPGWPDQHLRSHPGTHSYSLFRSSIWEIQNAGVLFPAGMKLIFFLAPGVVLHFGFQVRAVLIAHWCFSCCWAEMSLHRAKDISAFHAVLPARVWGAEGAGREQICWPKGYSIHTVSCRTIQVGELGWGAAQGMAGHWLADGEWLHCASLVSYIIIVVLVVIILFFFPFLSC